MKNNLTRHCEEPRRGDPKGLLRGETILKRVRLLPFLRLLAMTSIFLSRLPFAFAYTDDVQAGIDEAWQAAGKVFTPIGIHKTDEKKKYMESRWLEDEVIRKNHLFKDITSQVYRRRYRMKVRLTESGENIQVQVTGEFEERPKQSPVTAPWRKLKPEMEDYDLERGFFNRILAQMAKARR